MLDQSAAFVAACQGSEPDVTALEWLSGILSELEETRWPDQTTDPEAARHALTASRTLLAGLLAAVVQATEEQR